MAEYVYNFYSSAALLLPALIILIICFFLLRKRFSFNTLFLRALLPFGVFAAAIRTLADKGLVPYGGGLFEAGYYTHTPGLWLATGIVFVILLFSFKYFFKERALKIIEKLGWILAAFPLLWVLLTAFPAQKSFLLALAIAVIPIFAWLLIGKKFKSRFFKDNLNLFAFSANSLDMGAAIVSFSFLNCIPKHEATGELIAVSPIVFVIYKIAFVIIALFLIELIFRKIFKDRQKENYSKIFLGMLSVITGVRAWLFIGSGICGLL